MRKLQIIRFENDLFQIANLQIGNNIIGRNGVTGSNNGQTIKHAVTINLSPSGDMTLTPVSPCYIKSTGSSRWHLIKLGTAVPIKPGDICSLLSDKCWFKIITMSETVEKHNHLLKRKCSDDIPFEPMDKKICFDSSPKSIASHGDGSNESQDNKDSKPIAVEMPILSKGSSIIVSTFSKDMDARKQKFNYRRQYSFIKTLMFPLNVSSPENNQTILSSISMAENPDLPKEPTLVKENSNVQEEESKKVETNVKQDHVMHSSDRDESHTLLQKDVHSSPTLEQNKASVSGTEQVETKRNKCIYKDKCYRKNPHHKVQFSHPGDPDFEEVDERPECPYGIHCYRKNLRHRAQFKHSTMRKRRAPTPVRSPRCNNESVVEVSSGDESVDESEYEPSEYSSETNSDVEDVESDVENVESDWNESNSDIEDSKS
ncbi:aprataxin and PNK-like factor isoform X2 [Vespula squamosa]|uniref:Aprataxin and PNK-like factor isoform X2 n=1 Tax=Vespula squamosa TaxID=30214 RepID=A0ABD2ABB3_VESSQ